MFPWFKRGGWLVLVGLAGLVAAGWLVWSAKATIARLATDGLVAEAEIVEMFEQITTLDSSRRRSSDGETRDYFATVSFVTDAGQAMRLTQVVSKPWYDTWFPGQVTPVRYLPDDPEVFEIDPGYNQGANLVGSAFVAGFSLLPILLGLYMVRLFAGQARLRDQGQQVPGRVTKISRSGQWRRLHYSFVGTDGRERRGQSLPKGDNRFDGLSPGTVVTVLVDPLRPGNHGLLTDMRPA